MGTAGALVVDTVGTGTIEQTLITQLVTPSVGDKHRLVVNYLNDSNYFFVEIETTATNSIIRLYKRSGGSNTLLRQETIDLIDYSDNVNVCISESSFTFYPNIPLQSYVWSCDPGLFAGGVYAGLGNGGSSQIEFADFTHSRFMNEVCCSQQCHCTDAYDRYCIIQTLTLTLAATGACAALDGATTSLIWDRDEQNWRTSGSWPASAAADSIWRFGCSTACNSLTTAAIAAGKQFILDVHGEGCGQPDTCLEYASVTGETSKTCSPLSIVFPTHITVAQDPPDGLCGACDDESGGTWTATVTE